MKLLTKEITEIIWKCENCYIFKEKAKDNNEN